MSGAQTPAGGPAGSDPSMEDILASIRRILSEDEPPLPATSEDAPSPVVEPPPAEPAETDDVLVLDNSMLVPDQEPLPEPDLEPEPEPVREPLPEPVVVPELRAEPEFIPLPPPPELLGPAAAAAATSSFSHLARTVATDRSTQVYHGGPTIEDVVREEVRPLLKQWLDENLPPLVERLVRIEIERVVGRAVP